jgi:hypothetical protein
MTALPSIRLGSLAVSRLVLGTNPISGFSHASAERSAQMLDYFTMENSKGLLRACEARGIDAVIGRVDSFMLRLLREHRGEGGRIQWIAQTAPEHRDPRRNIAMAVAGGAAAVYVHGGEVDRLFDEGQPDEIRRRLEWIREHGRPAGMAAHRPEELLHAQQYGFPVDFFLLCLYRLRGYRGRPQNEPGEVFDDRDRAAALAMLARLDRPCLVYKVLAAGRKSIDEGLADVAPVLRPGDGVVLGMFPPDATDIVGANVGAFLRWTAPR